MVDPSLDPRADRAGWSGDASFLLGTGRAQGYGSFNERGQPTHLLGPSEPNEIVGHHLRDTTQHRPDEACETKTSAQQDGRSCHLINASKGLPNRMSPQHVIALAPLERNHQFTPLRGPHASVMDTAFLRESPCLPPLHLSDEHGD